MAERDTMVEVADGDQLNQGYFNGLSKRGFASDTQTDGSSASVSFTPTSSSHRIVVQAYSYKNFASSGTKSLGLSISSDLDGTLASVNQQDSFSATGTSSGLNCSCFYVGTLSAGTHTLTASGPGTGNSAQVCSIYVFEFPPA